MKIYYLMIISILFSACSLDHLPTISDNDNDGYVDGFFGKVYIERERLDFHNLISSLITDADSGGIWYKGSKPIKAELDSANYGLLTKNGNTYRWEESPDNNKYAIYQKMDPSDTSVGTGLYFVMVVEATPIIIEDSAVLLMSKTDFLDVTSAHTYAKNNDIPELSVTIPFLDLVFDPNTLIIEYNNKEEHLATIKAGYTLLEIFGTYSYSYKKELLMPHGYDVLLN